MAIAPKTAHTTRLRTYTLEEIDEELFTLVNLRKYSKSANIDDVNKRIDAWLDRRVELQEVGDDK